MRQGGEEVGLHIIKFLSACASDVAATAAVRSIIDVKMQTAGRLLWIRIALNFEHTTHCNMICEAVCPELWHA
eukprot:1663335-Karenia_brevis.AAC.1